MNLIDIRGNFGGRTFGNCIGSTNETINVTKLPVGSIPAETHLHFESNFKALCRPFIGIAQGLFI